MTTTYTCDHCGGACSGHIYASLWDAGDETKGYKHTRLDGCTQEHLGLVVAKSFGIPINRQVELVIQLEARNTRLNKDFNEAQDELHAAKTRITELEQRLAERSVLVDADGKTPGFVAREVFMRNVPDLDSRTIGGGSESAWQGAALAVLRAFGNGAKALQRVRGALLENSHPCDGDEGYQVIDTEDATTIIDDEFAKLSAPANPNEPRTIVVRKGDKIVFEGAPIQEPEGGWLSLNGPTNFTPPIKPTKPLVMVANCTICGCPNERAFLEMCRGDAKHKFEAP